VNSEAVPDDAAATFSAAVKTSGRACNLKELSRLASLGSATSLGSSSGSGSLRNAGVRTASQGCNGSQPLASGLVNGVGSGGTVPGCSPVSFCRCPRGMPWLSLQYSDAVTSFKNHLLAPSTVRCTVLQGP